MFRFAIERDLQTLQLQAKAGSHLSNLTPAVFMLRSPCADYRNLPALSERKDRPDPPVIAATDPECLLVWEVLGSTSAERVDIQDKDCAKAPTLRVAHNLHDCGIILFVVRCARVHHHPDYQRELQVPDSE